MSSVSRGRANVPNMGTTAAVSSGNCLQNSRMTWQPIEWPRRMAGPVSPAVSITQRRSRAVRSMLRSAVSGSGGRLERPWPR